jgi:hypothetical protein
VKHGAAYYRQVFAHARVSPGSALVVESDPECCRWAAAAGARPVWIDADGAGDFETLPALAGALLGGPGG